jgi:hypothetical protein
VRSFALYGVAYVETHRLVWFLGQEEVWMVRDGVAKVKMQAEGSGEGRGRTSTPGPRGAYTAASSPECIQEGTPCCV